MAKLDTDILQIEEYLDAADEKELTEKDQANLDELYRKVFGTPQGYQLLEDLLSMCNIWGRIFTGNASTYVALGQRNVGMYILKRLGVTDLTGYMALRKQFRRK